MQILIIYLDSAVRHFIRRHVDSALTYDVKILITWWFVFRFIQGLCYVILYDVIFQWKHILDFCLCLCI